MARWAGFGLAVVVVVVVDCVVVLWVVVPGVVAAALWVEVDEEEPHALTSGREQDGGECGCVVCLMVLKDAGRRRLLPPDLNNG